MPMIEERKASGGGVRSLKAVAKNSRFVHSAYKFVRDARAIPAGRWLHVGQLADIFKVLPNTMLPMPRLFDVRDAVVTINGENIPGDIVECGVWNGGCVGLMALTNQRNPGPPRRIHLFDSFEGMPPPTPQDSNVYDEYQTQSPAPGGDEIRAIGACVGLSKEEVESFLKKELVIDSAALIFHPGWFQDTVPAAADAIQQVALLRLDGDWYESTKVCLEGLFDKVAKGGYLIIDDYGDFEGCRRATDEFFAARGVVPAWVHSDVNCVYWRK